VEPSFLTMNPTNQTNICFFSLGKKRKALTSCFSNKNINKHLHHVFLTKTSTNTYIMVFSHPKRAPTSFFLTKIHTHILFTSATHEIPLCNLEDLTFLHTHGWMDGWMTSVKPTFKMWARWDLFIQFLNDYYFHLDLCQQ
jgi:hypothetical protein